VRGCMASFPRSPMTADDWVRLKQLFEQALEMSPDARAAFVEGVRLDDEELGRQLASLLREHERETNSIDEPIFRFHEHFPAETPLFSEGEVILDRFRIVRLLGRGGMGEVYEANDLQLGRVALKTIRPEVAGKEHMLLRFKQEVQLARKVTSTHVCRIHELYLVPGNGRREPVAFLSMELLAGSTLADRIEGGGALPFRDAEAIALQLCTALQAIHDAGVIHRDFKSRNVMLVPRNGIIQAVVMDLGLAREAVLARDVVASITMPGIVMGTPEYMAPEQFEGRPVTPATDIYALGVVLYECVTGTHPFQAATPIAAAIRRAKRSPAASSVHPDLPHHWDDVIGRCLEYEPERRYQSASEVAAALQNRPSPVARVRRAIAGFSRQRRLAMAFSTLVILAVIAAVVWYALRGYPAPSHDAQRWYEAGVSALREGTYLKATQALGRALLLDDSYVLAHARLADAWAELDFRGKAQEEMLRASSLEERRRLPKIDKEYLDAVRATLTGQFPAAVQDYLTILRALPSNEKAYGYVDLGRAHEKAGNISEAKKDYSEAAKLAPEYPASYMRLAVLESRQAKNSEAEAAFAHAEKLYRAASNTEGIAEIDYQRGYAASVRRDLTKARTFLEESLHAARDISSAQLEIRALTRMSVVEYQADNPDKSIELANTAIELAKDQGIQYWSIEGMIRLGNVYADKRDYAQAEARIQKALQLLQENPVPRLEALARISLASMRNQQGKPDDTIANAQAALDYYQKMGVFDMSTTALTLILRGRRDKAEFKEALPVALEVLDAAKKSNNQALIETLEESVGGLLLSLERYPDALSHYQAALTAGRATGTSAKYEVLHCADALWRLGRYADAEQMIGSLAPDIKKNADIRKSIDRIMASMALSQTKFSEALRVSRQALGADIPLTPGEVIEFQIIGGLAEAQLGVARQAQESCQAALSSAQREAKREMIAEASLCAAAAYRAAGLPQQATPQAEAARTFFSNSQQKESEWRGLVYLSEACSGPEAPACSKNFASKALDILSEFEHNWGTPMYRTYSSRPDIQAARRRLSALARK
jgi:tetratricopeptide (TPR) repeat protein